ncbi:MAG TPA: thiamine-phosphate kinase [Acidimicrobiales bacterium]|nr:thiamine-phosphate kinase [Acidimicrobiales bacterium]
MGSPKPGHTPTLGEDETLQSIRGLLGNGIERFGLRDDAGVLGLPAGGSLVVSVDSVVEGVHFDLAFCSPSDVGWKALMRALSDLAAMGAAPLGALIALCVPAPVPVGSASGSGSGSGSGEGVLTLGVMAGVAEASVASGCPVVGGDVSSAGELVVAVTVLGTVEDGAAAVSRSGAVPGDALFVTGPCGGSAAGLRELRAGLDGADAGFAYRRPVARLDEGAVARRCGVHAMLDVSDGLALDLHRLADASGVGFTLDAVPVASGATLDEALGGGEDYQLVMAVAEADVEALEREFDAAGLEEPVRVGSVVADPELRLLGTSELERLGWQHRVG